MRADYVAAAERVEAIPPLQLLEGLARIHSWIFVVDAERRVVWRSPGLSSLPGVEELVPGVDARRFLDRLPKPEQVFPLRSRLRGRRHLEGAQLDLCGPDGSPLPVDLDLVRIDGESGDLLLVIARERTSEHPSGEGLDAQLLDALPDALLAVDGEGFVRRANRAACVLLGCEREAELVARPVTTLLSESPEDLDALAGLLAADGCTSCDLRWGSDDADRWLRVTMTPLSAGQRAVALRDVSEERRAGLELGRAHEELDHCIGALAHDLRSPLVALLGFSRLLRSDYDSVLDDTGRHFVDRIERAARTMEGLIHELLELARIGEPGERPSLVDSREVLFQLAAELKPRLEEAGIELALPSELVSRVYCDRARLYQVFANLIGNAIEHMGERPDARIEVSVEESEREHEIVVADNGRGIDPAQRERIFEIFQSLGTRSDGRRGTGMGLAIVKKIAEKRGGRAWVESEPGAGARFHVTLPND